MHHKRKISEFLDIHGITIPVEEFIAITSNIYHKFEATIYDDKHLSIQLSIPSWSKAIKELTNHFVNGHALNVLDFGCGTGFATEQVLRSNLKEKCSHMSCYDLSPDMVDECKSKFGKERNISFLSNQEGLKKLIDRKGKFDIILCNAVLHHILDIEVLFPILTNLLNSKGIIVIGHEPNRNFYHNSLLTSVSSLYRLVKKVDHKVLRAMRNGPQVNADKDISVQTYNELRNRGLIKDSFPLMVIPKLIDIHVPISSFKKQPWGELGFNGAYLVEASTNKMELIAQFSYNHIKDQNAYASWFWRGVSRILARVYPKDGADAIFILKGNI